MSTINPIFKYSSSKFEQSVATSSGGAPITNSANYPNFPNVFGTIAQFATSLKSFIETNAQGEKKPINAAIMAKKEVSAALAGNTFTIVLQQNGNYCLFVKIADRHSCLTATKLVKRDILPINLATVLKSRPELVRKKFIKTSDFPKNPILEKYLNSICYSADDYAKAQSKRPVPYRNPFHDFVNENAKIGGNAEDPVLSRNDIANTLDYNTFTFVLQNNGKYSLYTQTADVYTTLTLTRKEKYNISPQNLAEVRENTPELCGKRYVKTSELPVDLTPELCEKPLS